ncbi:glycosyltransferase [Gammaproteobacteria bacterium]|nr:glycosyltransferase [Gammaproteobacteria bacterium]
MNILFIHQNFPGQFKHLAPALTQAGHDVKALILSKAVTKEWNGVSIVPYALNRTNSKDVHPWALDFESKVIRGEACLKAALSLKHKGYYPDVIVAHPGWGESLFLQPVWPDAKLKLYCEFYYHEKGVDVGFDPEFSTIDPEAVGRVELKNANILLQFQNNVDGISPTHWQANTHPKHIRKKITVIHDGIDTDKLIPNDDVKFVLDTGKLITRKDEVITFVSRTLEPYRGFHTFMRALPALLTERPNAIVLIVGKETGGYGAEAPPGKSWKKQFVNEIFPELNESKRSRVHFLNTVSYDRFISLLQVSRVHIYLTYPFVLSWSLLEAMSVGCAIVASDTQPLHEAITHNKNGLLINFFDHSELSAAVNQLLQDELSRKKFSLEARRFAIERYDLKTVCLPGQIEWVVNKGQTGQDT